VKSRTGLHAQISPILPWLEKKTALGNIRNCERGVEIALEDIFSMHLCRNSCNLYRPYRSGMDFPKDSSHPTLAEEGTDLATFLLKKSQQSDHRGETR
jgi:hypothetical protein